MNYLAQTLNITGVGTFKGPLDNRFTSLASIVSAALPLIFPIAGFILLIYLIWGGFSYLTSMGDPKKAEAGKNRITYAVLGFFIIFAAYWITQAIAFLLNLQGP